MYRPIASGIFLLVWNTCAFGQTGSFILSIDGTQAGVLRSSTGGTISAGVVNETPNVAAFTKKHLSTIQYETFETTFGLSMTPSFFDLLENSLKPKLLRFDGKIDSLDGNGKIRSTKEFKSAFITELGFPALDASSKEQAFLAIKFKADSIRSTTAEALRSDGLRASSPWISANFRLEMDGLDSRRVSRIEPIQVKRQEVAGKPGGLEFSNLKITMPEAFAKTWQQWHADFVVRGSNSDAQEKEGQLILLAADLRTELGRVSLHQCGIYRLSDTPGANGAVVPNSVTAEVYCESMDFDFAPKS